MPGRGKGAGRKRRQPSPTTRAGAKRGRQDDDQKHGESLILIDRPERLSDTWVLGDSFVRWAGAKRDIIWFPGLCDFSKQCLTPNDKV
ncbi:hypothetical protein DPMN_057137 [Dreissena polymorpha]|uniref:Uncharacterized protein n=1 Tax=Dreissena polymorpha TaxID=45954 RepID=A0A9D4CUK2_DREPO|nr:hypothetical protein DPMN_057137 [Dreissena polymorpha]